MDYFKNFQQNVVQKPVIGNVEESKSLKIALKGVRAVICPTKVQSCIVYCTPCQYQRIYNVMKDYYTQISGGRKYNLCFSF